MNELAALSSNATIKINWYWLNKWLFAQNTPEVNRENAIRTLHEKRYELLHLYYQKTQDLKTIEKTIALLIKSMEQDTL